MIRTSKRLFMVSMLIFCIMLQGCAFGGIGQSKTLTAQEVYEKVLPSVVEITGQYTGGSSVGSGFFCDSNGTVITNYHVIEKCTSAVIKASSGETYTVEKVLGYSESKDIAILSTNCQNSVPVLRRRAAVQTGETVYTIGSSLGFLSGTLSNGIVSAAEREVDGHVFIQTTAPISQGNSGGPLLDDKGGVVGITTASFVEGQNLNLAIPIAEVENIDTNRPIRLDELFSREVEWISERDFFYYDEEDAYVLVFELADTDKVPMASSGSVDIKIVNDAGVTVYQKTREFTELNFGEWTYNDTEEKYLAAIYIKPGDIANGKTSDGKVFFTVYGEDFYFDESTLTVNELPVLPIQIEVIQMPKKVNYIAWDGSVYTTTRVDEISYKIMYNDSLYMYFTGTKTYDCDGAKATNPCFFQWKLYDSEGYLIDEGSVYKSGLEEGDKFKGEEAYAFDCLEAGEAYKIVVSDYD